MRSVFLTIILASTALSLRCPCGWSIYQSNCYRYYPQRKTFTQSLDFCEQQIFYSAHSTKPTNSKQVSIHSPSENEFVFGLVPSGVTVWLGLYVDNNFKRGAWLWTDGSPFDYSNWAPGEPNGNKQDYGSMWNCVHPKKWDDANPNSYYSFVCKVPAGDCLKSQYESKVYRATDCKNGGKFNGSKITGGVCICPSPYSCIDCSWYNGCMSNPCQNGGKCIDKEQSYSCECENGFTGIHCEIYAACLALPCMNGGNCSKDPEKESFVCTCPEDYSGATCQTYIGYTSTAPNYLMAVYIVCIVILVVMCTFFVFMYRHYSKKHRRMDTDTTMTDYAINSDVANSVYYEVQITTNTPDNTEYYSTPLY
ncbi:delta-like protein 4 [Anneissia japonica]|uniref:delta-like protein 4 n=1 Tax=Anneissia japonica TaxID=1529436 RepID=UPI00142596EA|nr:delta-like protein 4 [Anneissia japonica]